MKHRFVTLAALTAVSGAQLLATPARAFDGCLGAKVVACLDGVRPYISEIDYRIAAETIDKYLAGDITGKRKAKSSLLLSYHSRFSGPYDPAQSLVIDYSASLATIGVEIGLRPGVQTAESEDDYLATHMYEAVLFALGTRAHCRELATPQDFYLFFHTHVRPKLKMVKVQRAVGEFKPPAEFYADTGWIGICGNQVNYIVSAAAWGPMRADMARRYGSFMASLAFR
ncbi:hypothetical protein K9U39_06410 [Rhodoblastus acidophilus]|uniref:Uncharacterized protein n=1 Tax=Candidatus Rhodoblastus alkanivorans TaxID=2954117 RepID=A0ABS9Z6K6_9HYPH|nr:hypothetical protein [Candidatus Rhodoblastus alkanivorans]MCI4680760.1 hypothetical protein [Candidatus Rhodoblastus alkanivorans]MCI4683273.1 hypothetical protein [Candidatus Rhodoblastus alkanivorans]MDI4640585.1 hypothetical protein [Rhodoblastus acidophilus]